MPRPISLIVSAALLGACAHNPPPQIPQQTFAPTISRPTAQASSADLAQQICSVDSLRAWRNEAVYEARRLDLSGASAGQAADIRDSDRDGYVRVDQPPFGPQTETTSLVRAFETDLDAAYQFAASACRTYAMCMSQRDFEERACERTRMQWDRALGRFSETSARLGELRLSLATHRARAPEPAHPHMEPRQPPQRTAGCADDRELCGGPVRRARDRDCPGVVADLFTSSRC